MALKEEQWVTGTAQPSSDAEDDTDYPVAMLWLPDPTQLSGWTDRWVKRQRQNAGQRKAGYRL